MRWLRSLRPRDGAGSTSWQYPCAEQSIRGRACVLPERHGRMHRADTGYSWAERDAA